MQIAALADWVDLIMLEAFGDERHTLRGVPRRLGCQLRFAHNVDYFAEVARQFVANGSMIVGGCCGTTPAHARAVRSRRPSLTDARVRGPSRR